MVVRGECRLELADKRNARGRRNGEKREKLTQGERKGR